MKNIILILILCFVTLLCGCTSNNNEPINTISLATCMQDSNAKASKKGENITYYYSTPDEISLYYAQNWKKGIISWKRYFINEEQYNLQKALYPNAVCKDKDHTIFIKEYLKVDDMDAHWDSIENSSIYKIVK